MTPPHEPPGPPDRARATDGQPDDPFDEDLEAHLRDALAPPARQPDEQRVAAVRAAVDAAAGRRPDASRVGRRRVLAVAAGVALLGVGGAVGALVENRAHAGEDDLMARGTPEFDATLQGSAPGSGVEVRVEGARAPEGRILLLRSQTLPVLPAGEYYELWFLPDAAGRAAISAGTFHPDEQGRTLVVLHAAVDPRLAGRLEITHEGDGPGEPVAEGALTLL